VTLADLAVRDALLVNLSGEQPVRLRVAQTYWIGAETHKLVTNSRAKARRARKKK